MVYEFGTLQGGEFSVCVLLLFGKVHCLFTNVSSCGVCKGQCGSCGYCRLFLSGSNWGGGYGLGSGRGAHS